MANLAIKAVVSYPDGSLFYREEHEWPNLSTQELAWFEGKLAAHLAKGQAAAGKKEDSANLSVTLSATGKPDTTITGLSYHAISQLEREWHKLGDELIKLGEEKAKHKK